MYIKNPMDIENKSMDIINEVMGDSALHAGKDTTVGLSGGKPGTPPEKNRAFAVDIAEAGFVALAPDYLRDGERIKPGRRPYDTTDFYQEFPDWSVHGKDAWAIMPEGLWLSAVTTLLALIAAWIGYSGFPVREVE